MAGINFLGIKSGSSQSKAHKYLAAMGAVAKPREPCALLKKRCGSFLGDTWGLFLLQNRLL